LGRCGTGLAQIVPDSSHLPSQKYPKAMGRRIPI
jgi:hypothetical protein